jgi:uncharacterized membrane protein YvbJ
MAEAEERAKREAEEAAKAARPAIYCPKCGAELRPDTSFCHNCGTLVRESEKAQEAEEAKKAKEAEERVPIFVERPAEPVKTWTPLLKRWWLWVGVAALVVLIALFIFILVALGQGG